MHKNTTTAKNIAARALIDQGVRGVIVTDGKNGLTARTKDVLVEMPSYKVTQLDPTGAGDALCAGIINFIYTMQELENVFSVDKFTKALLLGQATGAACVTGIGATTNVTKRYVSQILPSKGDLRENTRTVTR